MSMLGSQIKELREVAFSIQGSLGRCRYRRKDVDEMQKISGMLFKAADTIESLRDKLQATSETCEDVSTKNGIFKCSECGCTVEEDGIDWGGIHYCPDCGKWVSA